MQQIVTREEMMQQDLYVNDEAQGSIYPEDLNEEATFILKDEKSGAGYLLEDSYDGTIPAGSYIVYLQS